MLIRTILIVVSSALTLGAGVPYLRDVWAQKTKPRVVTWLVWSLLTGLAAAASFSDHQYASAVLTASETVETLTIAVLGLMMAGILAIASFDVVCLIGALVGLGLWWWFNSPAMAVLASVIVDLIGSLPTIKHMWQKPFEETWSTFFLSSVSGLAALLAATDLRITAIASPIDILLVNALFVAIILGRREALMGTPTAQPVSGPATAPVPAPAIAAPMKLAAASVTQTLTLVWLPVPEAQAYYIYRDGLALGGSSGTSFVDTTVRSGSHRYCVTASAAGAEGLPSDEIVVHMRQMSPELGQPVWSANPVVSGAPTTLTVPLLGRGSPAVEGEYFGAKDPSAGGGIPMQVSEAGLSASIVSPLNPGSYTLQVRARDADGNWSASASSVLEVLSARAPAQPQPAIASGIGQA